MSTTTAKKDETKQTPPAPDAPLIIPDEVEEFAADLPIPSKSATMELPFGCNPDKYGYWWANANEAEEAGTYKGLLLKGRRGGHIKPVTKANHSKIDQEFGSDGYFREGASVLYFMSKAMQLQFYDLDKTQGKISLLFAESVKRNPSMENLCEGSADGAQVMGVNRGKMLVPRPSPTP